MGGILGTYILFFFDLTNHEDFPQGEEAFEVLLDTDSFSFRPKRDKEKALLYVGEKVFYIPQLS